MNFKNLFFAAAIASASSCSGEKHIYKSPKIDSFVTIGFRADFPANVTTPTGDVGVTPVRSGDIEGKFHGSLVANLTNTFERVKFSKAGGQYSDFESTLIFEDDKGGKILSRLHGLTTYGNDALHGFGYTTLETTIPELEWINYAMFVAEWESHFKSGFAEVEIFQVSTGGRVDGKPIDALEPPKNNQTAKRA